jgi:purine-binding chemotaxis protein CheW
MDIAKIRKKSQAEAQNQTQNQAQIQVPIPSIPEQSVTEQSAEAGQAGQAGYGAEKPAAKPEVSDVSAVIADEAPAELLPPRAASAAPSSPGVGDGQALESENNGGITELLTFSLAREEFAFKVTEVEEIIRFQRIAIVPTMPDYVAGITSLRGKIIPVIDLRTRLALKDDGEEPRVMPTADADGLIEGKGKIIILSGPLGLIGAIIDKVIGVVRLPDDVILEPPAHLTENETRFIEGVVIVDKRFISIVRSEDALNIEIG